MARAVVTGGSRGVGRAIVAALENDRWEVIVWSRSTGVDVTDRTAVDAAAREAGAVGLLVTNAGGAGQGPERSAPAACSTRGASPASSSSSRRVRAIRSADATCTCSTTSRSSSAGRTRSPTTSYTSRASAESAGEVGPGGVALGDNPPVGVRPADRERRIVPADTPLQLGSVELGDQVQGLRAVGERLIPVRHPPRHVQHPRVFPPQLDRDPPP